jgi:hypothetical protein
MMGQKMTWEEMKKAFPEDGEPMQNITTFETKERYIFLSMF